MYGDLGDYSSGINMVYPCLPTLLYLTLHTLFENHMVYYLYYCFTHIIPISRMLTDMATRGQEPRVGGDHPTEI